MTAKAKIALAIHSLDGGGAERLMSQLAGRWAESHEVHLITWADASTDRYSVPESVRRHALGLNVQSPNAFAGIFANIRRVSRLRGCLKELRPRFVLSFCDQMNITTLEAARGIGMPVWIAEHNDPRQQQLSRLWESWRARAYRTCEGCVALTDDIATYMQRWVSKDRLHVIPPAIAMTQEARQGVSDSLGDRSVTRGRSDAFTFLFTGRLCAQKNVRNLLAAWRIVTSRTDACRLIIAGSGEERAQLEGIASDLPRVHFAGWVSDVLPLYRDADVFVLPSNYEGFPVSLLEAMTIGLPSITTNCTSAISELLVNSERQASRPFEVVPPRDSLALADAMLRVFESKEHQRELREGGRQVASNYQWTKIGLQWDRLRDFALARVRDA